MHCHKEAVCRVSLSLSLSLSLSGVAGARLCLRLAQMPRSSNALSCFVCGWQVVELGSNPHAEQEIRRLTPIVEERREKMKEEMLGAAGPPI